MKFGIKYFVSQMRGYSFAMPINRLPKIKWNMSLSRLKSLQKHPCISRTYTYFSFIGVAYCAEVVNMSQTQKLPVPNPEKLTHQYLIRNAATTSIEACCTLYLQSVAAYTQALEDYNQAMKTLCDAIQYSIDVHGQGEHVEAPAWDMILEARSQHKVAKEECLKYESFVNNVKTLVNIAAETSFQAGSEYPSVAAVERLLSGDTHLSQQKTKTSQSEKFLIDMEKSAIEVFKDHEDKT